MKRLFFGMLAIAGLLLQPSGRVGAQQLRTLDSTSRFVRTVGPNGVTGKKNLDKRFFGDFNARIEYLFEPSFSEPIGCRIYREATDTAYILEVKRVSNYKEVGEQLQKEFPTVGTAIADFAGLSPKEQQDRLSHNKKVLEQRMQESWRRYEIRTISVPISDQLADRLYAATKEEIFNVEPEKKQYTEEGYEIITVISDGAVATFRCVVNDTVWTLRYHVPREKFKAFSDLFRAMIADVEAGQFDEAKYLGLLN